MADVDALAREHGFARVVQSGTLATPVGDT
jgi:hypothetical protein